MEVSYKASILNALKKAIEQNPDMTFANILVNIERSLPRYKHRMFSSDEQYYESVQQFLSMDQADEPYTDEEFKEWVEKQYQD